MHKSRAMAICHGGHLELWSFGGDSVVNMDQSCGQDECTLQVAGQFEQFEPRDLHAVDASNPKPNGQSKGVPKIPRTPYVIYSVNKMN